MGQMRFLVPFTEQLPESAVERSYLAGVEGIPWRSRNQWVRRQTPGPGEFSVERGVSDSGNFYIPWNVPGRGELTLSTASLMERPEPYNLPLELARGTANRLRNQLADWQMMGLVMPPDFDLEMRRVSESFSEAATSGADVQRAARLSAESIGIVLKAMDRLAAAFAEQATAARQSTSPTLPTFLAIRVDGRALTATESLELAAAFNSAMMAFNWRDIELSAGKFSWDACDRQFDWCRNQGMRMIGGPLILLDNHNTPDWLHIWGDDFDQVRTSVTQYVRAVVERYRGKVHVWNCAARMNLEGAILLNEEQRLRLVVAVIDEVQRLDPRTPYIISFDQPWAEYLATAEHDFSPLHFADSLVRAELGLAGIGLELNFSYWPFGCQHRDVVEIGRLLDRWNMLGLPLLVLQSLPSSSSADPQARIPVSPYLSRAKPSLTPQSQRELAERMLRMVLAKPYLHGYVWQDISDATSHEFAHAGLLNAQSKPKPILQSLAELRRKFLT
jgi:hypothetical protein